MITLRLTVDDISTVLRVYNQIEIMRAANADQYPVPDSVSDYGYSTVSGVGPIDLSAGTNNYSVVDDDGKAYNWYITRYICSAAGIDQTCCTNGCTGNISSWSEPILGEAGDLFYTPLFPDEVSYGTDDQQIIQRIRTYIGDPVGLRREYGEDAASSIHPDLRTYELDEKGWPVSVSMNNKAYNDSSNPTVNGYRYLRFAEDINVTTTSGYYSNEDERCSSYYTVIYGVDIWYYTFRNSDRQIMEAYDRCSIPPGLTAANVTVEAYVLQTSINLLYQENWEDAIEDGAVVTDEQSRYDPTPGLRFRNDLLDKLNKQLANLVNGLILRGIEGVLLD